MKDKRDTIKCVLTPETIKALRAKNRTIHGTPTPVVAHASKPAPPPPPITVKPAGRGSVKVTASMDEKPGPSIPPETFNEAVELIARGLPNTERVGFERGYKRLFHNDPASASTAFKADKRIPENYRRKL